MVADNLLFCHRFRTPNWKKLSRNTSNNNLKTSSTTSKYNCRKNFKKKIYFWSILFIIKFTFLKDKSTTFLEPLLLKKVITKLFDSIRYWCDYFKQVFIIFIWMSTLCLKVHVFYELKKDIYFENCLQFSTQQGRRQSFSCLDFFNAFAEIHANNLNILQST